MPTINFSLLKNTRKKRYSHSAAEAMGKYTHTWCVQMPEKSVAKKSTVNSGAYETDDYNEIN